MEVVETTRDTPTGGRFDRHVFTGVIADPAVDPVCSIIQHRVIRSSIVCWTISKTATDKITGDKKFPDFVWHITEPRRGENRSQIETVVNLPVDASYWDDWVRFEWISFDSQHKMDILANLKSADGS